MKLGSRLVLLVVTAIVPVLAFATITAALFARQERATIERGVTETARALALAVDREMEASISTLEALATTEPFGQGDLPAIHRRARQVLPTQPGWRAIFVLDPEGRRLLDTMRPFGPPLPAAGGADLAGAVIASRRPQVSALMMTGPVTGEPTIGVAVPVMRGGTVRHVVGVEIDLGRLSGLLARQKTPPDWTAAVLDQQRRIIARSRAPERFIGRPATAVLAARSREVAEATFRDVTQEGAPALGAFSRSGVVDWTVVLGLPADVADASIRRSVLALTGGGALLLLLGITLALRLGRRIAAPIAALSEAAVALGHGEPLPLMRGRDRRRVDEVNRLRVALESAAELLRRRSLEREQAEAALRESHELFERFMAHSPVAAFMKDADGRHVYANPVLETMLSGGADHWRGRTNAELFPPAVARQLDAADRAVLESDQPRQSVETIPGPDGDRTWVVFRFPVRDRSGAHLLAGVALDVTERQRIEERFRELVDTVDAIVWEADARTFQFSFVSQQAETKLGYPVARWGEPGFWESIIHPDDRASTVRLCRDATAAGRHHDFEYRALAAGGRVVWMHDIVYVVLGAGGGAERLRGVMVDITERKRIEERLRAEREALEIVNRTNQIFSAELDQRTLVQAVTDAATRITAAEFGAFFYNVVDEHGEAYTLYTLSGAPPEAFARFPMPRNTGLFGPTFRGEKVIRLDDVRTDHRYGHNPPYHGMPPGHLPVASYLAVPVVSRSGEVVGGLFFGHSRPGVFGEREEQIVVGLAAQAAIAIDNARLYERTRRARAEAEEANRLKDEFLATLSHELRTPLNAVLGWARMLRGGRVDAPTTARALEVIERNAAAQTQLIEDLLDISRIITGKIRLEVRPVDLAGVIDAALDSVRLAAEARAIRLQSVLDPAAGPVAGDPDRLQQIAWNLLSNAIKFTPPGGGVEIRTQRVRAHVELRVSDTGRGIAAEVLPHVFERFRQADSSSTRAHGGLGIGLALVKHLVELHGGSVTADSPGEGQGAAFTVSLPLGTPSEPRED